MSSLLPPPRRIVTSNLPLPAQHSAKKNPEPAIQVLSEDVAQIAELDGILYRGTVFTHETIPTNNDGLNVVPTEIASGGIVMPKGANIRFNDLAPGQSVPMHRTQSTDYNIILNGSLYLLTPLLASDGTLKTAMQETLCNPGDVILQRGTLHGWENRSSEWVRWISVLLGADENKVEVEWKPEKVVLPNSF